MNVFIDNSAFTNQLVAATFAVDNTVTDITPFVTPGPNLLSFDLTNIGSGYTFGIEVRRDGTIVFAESCGIKNVFGCDNNSMELFTGREVASFRFDVAENAVVPEPTTLLLLGSAFVGLTALRNRMPRS